MSDIANCLPLLRSSDPSGELYIEGLCEPFYADEGRPGLPPGRYFRLLLIGYFETHEAVFTWMMQRLADAGLA